MIYADLETFRFRRPVSAPRPVCVQWCDRPPAHERDATVLKFRDGAADLIESWLDGDQRFAFHGGSFDWLVIMAWFEHLIPKVFQAFNDDRVEDTLLNQKLLDIAHGELDRRKAIGGHNLGEVARRHGREVDKEDPWRLRYGDLDGIPLEHWPDDAVKYAQLDATVLHTIDTSQRAICAAWKVQYGSPILHQGPARARYDLALRLAGTHGVRTNPTRTATLEKFTLAEIERMRQTLVAESRSVTVEKKRSRKGVPYVELVEQTRPLVRKDGSKDTKIVKSIVRELFEKRGEPVPLTDSKDISTEKDTMILAGAGWPAGSEERRLSEVLITYADYTTASNLLNRVEDLKQGFDLPLQPRYDSLLETGRTSSSKGTKKGEKITDETFRGIQIQNFPRGFDKRQIALLKELGLPNIGARECLEPREGNVFVLADYAGAELHALAQCHIQMFGKSSLATMLNSGVDVLLKFGCAAYGEGVSYDGLQKGAKNLEPFKGWRQSAKPIVYGRPGAMGPAKIVVTARKSYNVIMDLVEAKRLIGLYDVFVEEMPAYFDFINASLGGRKTGVMRQLFSGRWRGDAGYSAMSNSFFQGLTADGALEALYRVALECYSVRNSALYGFRIIAFVHDEVVTEGPEDRAHDAAMRLQHLMETHMNLYTPDVPTPAEPLITRIWSKDAKPVWKDDKLVPWNIHGLD